jgi:ankyrin repeat protein
MDWVHVQAQEKIEDTFWRALQEQSGPAFLENIENAWSAILEFELQHHAQKDTPYQRFDIDAQLTRKGQWFGCTPLCICVQRAFPEAVQFLVNTCGADVNVTSDDRFLEPPVLNRSPLHFAAITVDAVKRSYNVMLILLSHGADTSATDAAGKTVLHYVCCSSRPRNLPRALDALRSLLQYTKEDGRSKLVSQKDSTGKSAFEYAWSQFQPTMSNTCILNTLIENGANVNSDAYMLQRSVNRMQDRDGRCIFFQDTKTPRWYMAIKILLMGGADPFKLWDGDSATTLASRIRKYKHPACDNIIAIFGAIQIATDALHDAGHDDGGISRSEIEAIIKLVEENNILCNKFGLRIDALAR